MKLCRIRDFNLKVGQNFSVHKKKVRVSPDTKEKTDDMQMKYIHTCELWLASDIS